MDSDLKMVKVSINRVLFKHMLINIHYKYYSIMDKNLVIKLRLPCVKICHGASCLQANDADGRKNNRLEKERRREKEGSN